MLKPLAGMVRASARKSDPWRDLPWEQHEEARKVVKANPDGMTLEQIGSVLGLTRERVRQIETIALLKLKNGETIGQYMLNRSAGKVAWLVFCMKCQDYRTPVRGNCESCQNPLRLFDIFEYPAQKALHVRCGGVVLKNAICSRCKQVVAYEEIEYEDHDTTK